MLPQVQFTTGFGEAYDQFQYISPMLAFEIMIEL